VRTVYREKNGVTQRFRTRCRQLISLIYYSGLAYTLAYIASKAGTHVLDYALNVSEPEKIARQVEQAGLSEEEASYALYGAFLLTALKQIGVPGVSDAATFLDLLRKLNYPGTTLVAEGKILRFGEWLKRLAEAVFEAERT